MKPYLTKMWLASISHVCTRTRTRPHPMLLFFFFFFFRCG